MANQSTDSIDLERWRGTARYEVRRRIGQGGMGVVYEAFDREAERLVAVKTLRRFSPALLYRFKQEFRTLADVHHPNLVHLYELVASESELVFFTMELVRGEDFLAHVRQHGRAEPLLAHAGPTRSDPRDRPTVRPSAGACRATPVGSRPESPADLGKLRPALLQLVEGVDALHAARKLHRDIKPSNVLVTREGRVVLLDFGVATELSRSSEETFEPHEIVGTASYMAPEQALDEVPSAACDWYSVGVMLYGALVGSLPFSGPLAEVIALKNKVDPIAPGECVRGVPPDLDALCCGLLHRDPAMRPTGSEILRSLGARGSSRSTPGSLAPIAAVSLVGRERELATLRDLFGATASGRTVTVLVSGESGVGKSTLLQHFLDGLAKRGEAVVLRGRAYEQESVPYKAVDGVIDALSTYLVRQAEREEPVAPPVDAAPLARIFPVLQRASGMEDEADKRLDLRRVRGRAFLALRELFASVAARQPIVVYIDDVQWGDPDSAALLLDLVRPPNAPPLLLVMTYRDRSPAVSPFLSELRKRWPAGADCRELDIGPLAPPDARRLALALLDRSDEAATQAAEKVARESGGIPFLLEELARSVGAADTGVGASVLDGGAAVTVERMVSERVAALPDDARQVLELVAIGGRPVLLSTLAEAYASHGETHRCVSLLRARRLVRTGFREGHEVVETCHDRIRETIVAQFSPATAREHHTRLARVLERAHPADPEAVAIHLLGAGETERAAEFAERAAEQAVSKLAFEQAARLFRTTIETVSASSPEGRRLRIRLGEVLELAGRGSEAARAYQDAAQGAPPLERTGLERAAAEQLLSSGRIDEGAAVLHRVLSAVGMKAPRSAPAAVALLLVFRLWLRIVGLRFEERGPADVRHGDRVRLDALYTVSLGFAVVDVLLSACMTTRYLIAALRVGDRSDVLRAATLQVSLIAADGGIESKQALALAETARRLAQTEKNAEATAFFQVSRGVSLYLRGRWKAALEVLDSAFVDYPNNRAGWQSNGNLFAAFALVFSGQLRELARRQARLLVEAEERGDLYTSVNLRASHPVIGWLAADDPEGASESARAAIERWPRRKFLVQHWQAMLCEVDIELYAGRGERARERLQRDLRPLTTSLLGNVQIIRALTSFARGRCAIASLAAAGADRPARLAEARRMAGRLKRERMPWTAPLASILRAACANEARDYPLALASLRAAVAEAESADMAMYAAAARHRLGSALGGDEGRELLRQAEAAMALEDVRAPARFAALLVPGRWTSKEMGGSGVSVPE
jgi:serine/threonine protein kinase/tetratricopeptide (TPR) repeat protein